ncbi:hypothetical protein LshimejAT787_1500150 [Lyophyllum shimeji]|uniref:Uncharacterized protein n=1 Tax=Lyophyllum shimeji TaxID=47721 RepID=A0A9P3PZ90_LYOSH|nr:hypothetical protein LshimejAT787_1500150 [Lyophyllum shimeji]
MPIDLRGLIFAFDEDSGEQPGASTQSALNASLTSTTTSLESVRKRKLGGSPDTSRLTVDDRPPKKCKPDTDPNVPYIIASSHLVEQHPGPPYGVKFELGCLVSGCIGNICRVPFNPDAKQIASRSQISQFEVSAQFTNKLVQGLSALGGQSDVIYKYWYYDFDVEMGC